MSTASTALKTSPLHEEHERASARFVEFGGWRLPIHYSGILEEHHAVRNALGVFDISHMGQLVVRGPGAAEWLNRMLTNNLDRIETGECQYTLLLNEKGGIIDDLIAYRSGPDEFLLVVNAALTNTDVEHLESHRPEDVILENRSADYAGLAVQGPKSARLFDLFFGNSLSRPARNEIKKVECNGASFLVSRTGYTGEDGFEIFFPASEACETWRRILEKGTPLGIRPCGLGARDTLRLEMCYPLNGSDLSPDHTPLEAGLSIFVDLEKEEFIGREALKRQREEGVKQRLVPFKMKEKSPPPRAHYPVYVGNEKIAETTSGNMSPTLNIGIGMAYVPAHCARIRQEIEIEIRGRRFPALIEKKPLHRPQ